MKFYDSFYDMRIASCVMQITTECELGINHRFSAETRKT